MSFAKRRKSHAPFIHRLFWRYQCASAPLQRPDNAELTGNQPNADYQVSSTSLQTPDNQRSTGNFELIIVRYRVHYQCKIPVNSALAPVYGKDKKETHRCTKGC
ncbi:MAG: hypothetical protein KAJ63_14010, partial [Methyloprofundus sp.]|nr:hypothetical protein [Methyloprofundus sp.]